MTMLGWLVQTTLMVACLATIVGLVCRIGRPRPAIQHALWAIVLLKFLTPTLVYWPWAINDRYVSWLSASSRAFVTHSNPSTSVSLVETFEIGPDHEGVLENLIVSTDLEPRALDDRSVAGTLDTSSIAGTTSEPMQGATGSASAAAALMPSFTAHAPSEYELNEADWAARLLVLWLAGALIVTVLHVQRIQRVRRLVCQARPAPDWLVARIAALAKIIGVSPPLAIIAPRVHSPCLWCVGRPKLLWPDDLAGASPAGAWDGVIAHELAHLRRRDHWVAWLELGAGCVWWFNPLFWLVRKRLRESAELACDAWAVWTFPGRRRAYAESLIQVTRLVSRAVTPAPALGASTGARRSLERRLTMILSQPKPCRLSLTGALGACLLAVVALPAWSLDQSAPAVDATPPAEAVADPAAPLPSVRIAEPAVAAKPASPAVAADESADPRASASSDSDRIARLEKQLDTLLEEVRRLRNVRSRRPALAAGLSPLQAVAPDGKIIATISGVGQVTLVDAVTGKELARTNIGQEGAVRSIAFSPDGKQIAVQSDASEVITLDAATGKIHRVTKQKAMTRKSRLADSDSDTAGKRDRETHTRTTVELPTVTSRAARSAAAPVPSSISGAQLDLVRLATEYSDARGSLDLAERMLELARSTRAAGESTQKDLVTAEVQVKNAGQKVRLLREIAQAALQAAEAELAVAAKRVTPDGDTRAEAAQVEAKLRILKVILSR